MDGPSTSRLLCGFDRHPAFRDGHPSALDGWTGFIAEASLFANAIALATHAKLRGRFQGTSSRSSRDTIVNITYPTNAATTRPAMDWVSESTVQLRVADIDENEVNIVNVPDEVSQAGQGVIADRSNERLGHTDRPVILFRKLWERELKALAEGKPLRQ
jgi:hypothetical protein